MSSSSRKKKNVDNEEDVSTTKKNRYSVITRSAAHNANDCTLTDNLSVLPNNEIDSEPNVTLSLKPKVTRVDINNIIANTSSMSDREFSAVMDSAAMSNIKQEVVNAINGDGNTKTQENSTSKKRKRKRKDNDDEDGTNITPITERKKKKKVLDEIDIMSQNRKVYMRSRFTPKEKDMVFNYFVKIFFH